MRGRGGGWVMWSPQVHTSIEGQSLESVLLGDFLGFLNHVSLHHGKTHIHRWASKQAKCFD